MNSTIISFSGKTVYVGIDVHKKTYALTAICDKVTVKRASLPADAPALIRFLKKAYEGAKIHSVYEAGLFGFTLHRRLREAGIMNIVINPAAMLVAANDRVKTDKRDSEKLARELSDGRLRAIYCPSEEEEKQRALTRTREQLVRQRVRLALQIKTKLTHFGILRADDTRSISARYLRELCSREMSEDLRFCLDLLVQQWRLLTLQIRILGKRLRIYASNDPKIEAVYRSVPGVGATSARILAAELGNIIDRFPKEGGIYSFTGLTPSEYSSGGRICRGHITRQGSARLRGLLVEIAWRAISKDIALKEVFDRIAKRRGKKVAIVAVARRLIGRMRACFRTNVLYALGTVA